MITSLAEVAARHPGWHVWQGTWPHLRYARLLRSSPPAVVRARGWAELDRKISDYTRERDRG